MAESTKTAESSVTTAVDRSVRRWAPQVLRWTAALLWMSNVSWKTPPDFGGLSGYITDGVEHPVLPGSAWIFDNLIGPNLDVFGWVVIVIEVSLAATMIAGRYVRVAAVVGIVESLFIGAAAANADGEWYWSYALMMAVHLGILVTAPMVRTPKARTGALVVAGYGIAIAIVHAGAGFTGDGSWVLFSQSNDFPGDFGRNVFRGSIALGLIFVALGVGGWLAARFLPAAIRRMAGWGAVVVAALLLATSGSDGLIIGLGSQEGTAAVLAALGLALAVDRTPEVPDPQGSAKPGTDRVPAAAPS